MEIIYLKELQHWRGHNLHWDPCGCWCKKHTRSRNTKQKHDVGKGIGHWRFISVSVVGNYAKLSIITWNVRHQQQDTLRGQKHTWLLFIPTSVHEFVIPEPESQLRLFVGNYLSLESRTKSCRKLQDLFV